jgi:peptidoglycan-N-acetylglucosamine deacetylase
VKENDAKVRQEITKTYQIVEKLTGKKMAMLRPPYGAVKGKEKLIHQMGISVIQWDIDTLDWKPGQTPDRIYQNVVQHASPGSIVLQHSGGGNRSATVQALPRLIQQLKKEGYQFVTVNELLDIPAYHQD